MLIRPAAGARAGQRAAHLVVARTTATRADGRVSRERVLPQGALRGSAMWPR
jgi:hypothetical protein